VTGPIADLQVSSASKQYVTVPVEEEITDGDPTGDVVSLSFPNVGSEPTAFVSGSWLTVAGIYYAQALVGPGATVLAVGFYDIYVKVTDSPEIPVIRAGLLEIT
jgi:hypothetical protein